MTSEAADDHGSTAVQSGHEPKEGHFKKSLGLLDAVAVVVGSMIGSGIFIVSAETARHVGAPGLVLMCWLLAGLLTIAGALCYSELAGMYPKAGGQYVFLREAFGPMSAFLYGWTLFAVIQCGTIAAVGVAFAKFLGFFVPAVSNANVLLAVGGWKLTMLQAIAVALITFLTALNCRGIEAAKFIQTSFTVTKVCALAALIILGFLAVDKHFGMQVNFNMQNFWAAHDLKGAPLEGLKLASVLGLAMVGALFSCDAWNNITFAGEEVKDAEKVLPKSLTIGTGLVILIYLLANVVYMMLLPVAGIADAPDVVGRGISNASEDRVGTAAAQILFGSAGGGIMAGAIMISTFGCLNGLILAGARVYYAMARDGLFFKQAGHLDPTTNVPAYGLIIQGIWAAALATSGTYSMLLEYVVFAALLFYVLTVAAVFVLRKKRPAVARPYKVIAYPLLPGLYVVFALAVMAGLIYNSPGPSGLGLLLIASGLPIYFALKALSKSRNTPPEPN
jgi:APA family basic amino acid/polyamine antiporter